MKRRYFLALSGLFMTTLRLPRAVAADAAPVTDKDLLKEGQTANVANYCLQPDKQPNKFCPTKPGGLCKDCMFYNTDKSLTKFKGKDVAKCQLLPAAPSYVYATASCSTFAKRPG